MIGSRSPRRRPASSRSRGAIALLGVTAVLVLAGCAGGGDDSPSAGLAEDAAGVPAAQGGSGEDVTSSSVADGPGELSQASLESDRHQIMTAGLVVETDNVLSAARQAESIAIGAGGFVTDEDTQVQHVSDGDQEGPPVTVSSLTVRVPPAALDDVLGSLSALGDLVSQNRATTDVTDEYVDVEARLASQRASLDRLLQLVGSAGALDDVIALENEIARRQSDLDGLAARLKALDEETDLATIALTLTSQSDAVVEKSENGFLAGLSSGWDAFTGSVVAALTVIGALLPFAVVVALIGIPFLVIRRRRQGDRIGPDTATPAPPTAQA
jgi:hypothetical protein